MSSHEILSLTIKAIGEHAVHGLNPILGQLTENPGTPLTEETTFTAVCPVPVPMGQLRSRKDLGDLGILISVTAKVVPLEDYRKMAEEAAATVLENTDPGQEPNNDAVTG